MNPYLDFFGFKERPFGKTPDPAFLYESRQHKEALARLEYAVEERELALLTGDIGCGKTTISRALLDRIEGQKEVVLIINPRLSPAQFLGHVAAALGIVPARGRNQLIDQITERLYELYEAKSEAVLIIDEAQLVPGRSTFDEIRLLTNFQLDHQNLVTVILIGQPELDRRLEHPAFAALRQRIGIRYRLRPLPLEETSAYIEFRVRVAGARESPFGGAATGAIQAASGGVPRVINTLAATSLLAAFEKGRRRVGAEEVAAAAADLHLEMVAAPAGAETLRPTHPYSKAPATRPRSSTERTSGANVIMKISGNRRKNGRQ